MSTRPARTPHHTPTTSQGQPTCPTFQEPPLSVERQTRRMGEEEPSPPPSQPSDGPTDLSRARVGCVGRARPEAYPVLGEEPCRDTAYVLGMAGPAWCSRCGTPEQKGKEWRGGGKRMRRIRRKQGARWREERREGTKWERWTNRQTDSPERQAHQPPPHSHPAPQPRFVVPGLSFTEMGKNGPRNHTSL